MTLPSHVGEFIPKSLKRPMDHGPALTTRSFARQMLAEARREHAYYTNGNFLTTIRMRGEQCSVAVNLVVIKLSAGGSSHAGPGRNEPERGSKLVQGCLPGCAFHAGAVSFLFSFSFLFLRHLQKGKAIGV